MKKRTAQEKEKLLEPFKIALRIELEGKKFLSEAAEKSEHPAAKRTFEFLASEEDAHAAKIQRMYQAIAETGESIDPETDEEEAPQKIQEFNRRLAELKDTMKATDRDIEAYKAALEMEEDTEEFYRDRLNETDDANIKRIYRYLIAEERAHSIMLKSCLSFMESPSEWFKEQKGQELM
ncbi:MAG: ferritin family protein [Candidatus Zixiibacteriota bacterium]